VNYNRTGEKMSGGYTGMITDPQLKYIRDLVAQRNLASLNDAQRAFLADTSSDNLGRLTKKQASDVIKALLDCPKKVAEQPRPLIPGPTDFEQVNPPSSTVPQPEETAGRESPAVKQDEVEPGYFFIVDPTDQKEKFFRVSKGKDRWEGWTFLSVQASDFFYPIRNVKHREAVLAEIAKDPVNAMNQYGIRLGRCGVCNRTLTDVDSRLKGIGPICAARLYGQASQDELDLLNTLGLTTTTE
jgi:hypothetical protein